MPSSPTLLQLSYQDTSKKHKYKEETTVSAEDYGRILPMPSSGPRPDAGEWKLKHVAERLSLIARAIERKHLE